MCVHHAMCICRGWTGKINFNLFKFITGGELKSVLLSRQEANQFINILLIEKNICSLGLNCEPHTYFIIIKTGNYVF